MNPLSNSQRLREKINRVLPQYGEVSRSLIAHPRFRELYPELLITMHAQVRASVPGMRIALERCRELEDHDPLASQLACYFQRHIKEESGHDEWLLEDLELLGISREEVLRRMPSPAVASLVGSRYYWILHHHPLAELGYIATLEGYPPAIEAVDVMEELSGWPRAAFRTIEKHSTIDQHHRDEFLEFLDTLDLSDEQHALLTTVALHTVRGVMAMIQDVIDRADQWAEATV